MNLLILEPPYSKLFKDLASELNPKNTHVHIFNLGYLIYVPWSNLKIISKEIKDIIPSPTSIEVVSNIRSLLNSNSNTATDQQKVIIAKYYEYLESFIHNNSITHILCHNDLRWQHSVAKQISIKHGIKIYFSEEGLFRPDTLTFDPKGVNAFSSIPREKEFYLNNSFKPNRQITRTPNIPSKRIKRIINFVFFLLLNQLGEILRINSALKNKNYSFLNYLKLFISKLKSSKKDINNHNLPASFIFIPLQVTSDTQTIIHSPFNGTQEFISLVESSYGLLSEEIKVKYPLVFKKHPMESHINYKFHKSSIVTDTSTGDLLGKAALVVLINSTTIVEGLIKGKKIITLGESHYNISGLTFKSSASSLTKDIQGLIDSNIKTDEKLIESYLNYLKYHYQINGNIFYYNKDTLKKIKQIILQSKDSNS